MILKQLSMLLKQSVGYLFKGVDSRLYQTNQKKRVIPWFKDQGDTTLRLNYDLDETSLVFDLGGYKGQWTSDIVAMYCCKIHVFEPVIGFAEQIEKRFYKNPNILVHRLGLSNKTKSVKIAVSEDGSSIFKHGNDLREIRLVLAYDFLKDKGISKIDLMKINIEGGEYDLLDHLIDSGLIRRIKNIQVQFHDFVPNAEKRMAGIQAGLEKTHMLTYQYPFVWENWRIKDERQWRTLSGYSDEIQARS